MNASELKRTADSINTNPQLKLQREVDTHVELLTFDMAKAAEKGRYETSEHVSTHLIPHMQDFLSSLSKSGFTVSLSPTPLAKEVIVNISWK